MSAAIVAFGALSGLGRGREAASAGEPGERARVATVVDDELTRAGLARPFCSRVSDLTGEGDRATLLLGRAMTACMGELDRELPSWRGRRVGLALGTSSGGMREAEVLFRRLTDTEQARRSMYFSPMADVVSRSGMRFAPSTLILTACAASTMAIGLGMRWLEADACDLVLAGGFDAVSVFVASGFEALRATTARLPSHPFCVSRDGMALGEGAAVMALVRSQPRALAYVTGFGAAGDAVHVTAPDRTGDGLARAARRALAEADGADIALVSAHGTATPFNDAAESRAIRAVASGAVVHAFKPQIGHTLGAAGALESLVCIDAMRRGVVPASVVGPDPDPDAPATLLEVARRGEVRGALKLSAAFGGANASLVIERDVREGAPRSVRPVYVSRGHHVTESPSLSELAAAIGQAADRLAKACDLSRLALAAIQRLGGDLEGAGIVVGHAYATLDVNEQYNRRILERGARFVEPRKFPYTSPNGCAGECSVAFKLTGPNLAVGSGLHGGLEALVVASQLVAAGDADRMVVVAVDAPGVAARAAGWPVPPTGAVAVLVSSDVQQWRVTKAELGSSPARGEQVGHLALLPLCRDGGRLYSASPTGFATLEVDPCFPPG